MREQRMGKVLNTLGDATSDYLASIADQNALDYFGTTDVYSATTGQTPAPATSSGGFSFSDLGNILNAAGQVFAFGQQLDAAGNPVPVPSATPIPSSGMKLSPAILALLGVGAYLLIAK